MLFRLRVTVIAFALFSLVGSAIVRGGAAYGFETMLFDMGTDDSPLAEGYIRITAETTYSPQLGYGWTTAGHTSFTTQTPEREQHWHVFRDILYDRNVTPFNRDGVEGGEVMNFQIDLPPGKYHVVATIGNMLDPLGSISIYSNDELIAENLAPYAIKGRNPWDILFYGFYLPVRFDVDISGGKLSLSLRGDQSEYDAWLEENPLSPRDSWLVPGRVKGKRSEGPGHLWLPFERNSIMGIEVHEYRPKPFAMTDGELTFDPAGVPADVSANGVRALSQVAELFNQGDFAEAEALLDAIEDNALGYARAVAYAWLAGHPQYEKEAALLPKLKKALEPYLAEYPDDYRARDLRRLSGIFSKATDLVTNRTVSAKVMSKSIQFRASNWESAYFRLYRAVTWFRQMVPGDPYYHKSNIYAARALFMIEPHRWMMGGGMAYAMLREVEEEFPQNRYVRLYLHDDWPPGGDWVFPEYDVPYEEAPEWAAELWEAYNRILDLCEWWFTNKQFDDGSLGGGWGDDVEALRFFGNYGAISPQASPITLEGSRLLSDGAWFLGEIDTESGFFPLVADTQHTGEFTGDPLPVMMLLDYGNPVWIERSMKTGKLMRDLWMDFNDKGFFAMRANFLGAVGVGTGFHANDSRINYRPALPARSVLWYNGNPTLARLFNLWADAWLAAAMSTEKSKPKGVIPAEFAFQTMEIGGLESPSWYEANHPSGTVNYDWNGVGNYHGATVDLLVSAYQRAGDEKYLEPMRLEADLAKAYLSNPVDDPEPGSAAWAGKLLLGTPERPEVSAISNWERIERMLDPEAAAEPITTLEEVKRGSATLNREARKRWPVVTTDSLATDRIYIPGMLDPFQALTGYGAGGLLRVTVTYTGLERDSVAACLVSDERNLKVVLYNMSEQPKEVGIRPWILAPGSVYMVKTGADTDGDGEMDGDSPGREWTLPQRGVPIVFELPSRTQFVVEVSHLRRGAERKLLPDVGISREDITYSSESEQLIVKVHNVGSESARRVKLVVYDGPVAAGAEIGRHVIPHIPAPIDLDPKTVRIGFPYDLQDSERTIFAVLDPDSEIDEITDLNNQAHAVIGP
jgi:hypothetical protein